jgi:hypothetical protein
MFKCNCFFSYNATLRAVFAPNGENIVPINAPIRPKPGARGSLKRLTRSTRDDNIILLYGIAKDYNIVFVRIEREE